ELHEYGAWTVSLSASRSSAVGAKDQATWVADCQWHAPPHRFRRSRSPGNRDHDHLESVITMLWNERSRWPGTGDRDRLESMITTVWSSLTWRLYGQRAG